MSGRHSGQRGRHLQEDQLSHANNRDQWSLLHAPGSPQWHVPLAAAAPPAQPDNPKGSAEKLSSSSPTGTEVGLLGGPYYLCKFTITVTNRDNAGQRGHFHRHCNASRTDRGLWCARQQRPVRRQFHRWQCNDPDKCAPDMQRQPGKTFQRGGSVQVVVATATTRLSEHRHRWKLRTIRKHRRSIRGGLGC